MRTLIYFWGQVDNIRDCLYPIIYIAGIPATILSIILVAVPPNDWAEGGYKKNNVKISA